ncbi:zinc finger family protein [Trypanosoma rangeli]|uniref:Zinc finger family protein n=1 Tax=Trypanosoma rangeli TaxID=5698 RepID=A0A422NI17_TRYRA|nr:zinc finger family protein [Trypanosoma rangeli]RNF05128.1 zinc finger family protein [Trypanosoma rangeli]|eukprot:RNF05128.1 zinc finger family protein [Trypanosoma rangeli]
MARCAVCEKESSRYRCRLCGVAYCCSACYKAHRDSEPPQHSEKLLPSTVENAREKELGTSAKEEESKELQTHSSDKQNTSVACHEAHSKRERESEVSFIEGERDADGELVVLGEAHLSELAHNTNIRNKLRSSELQRLLRVIDSSRSRIDALEAAMANNPEFKEFCDNVLGVVNAAEMRLRPWVK